MSWFSGLKDFGDNLREQVTAAIPLDPETIQKLTLSTPELTAERQKIDEEEKRKERVRDSLSGMYPWETRDEERNILVEECKEAIMALSKNDDTFFGPFRMPPRTVVTEESEEEDEEGDGEEHGDDEDEEEEEEKIVYDKDPTPESLEQLQKLEPLPPLLGEFDLDAHVGLIQKMLQVDAELVDRQSILSGGGDREQIFWKNYFFHCAYTRYEAGLSIDEIWSDQPQVTPELKKEPDEALESSAHGSGGGGETTITFESGEQEEEKGVQQTVKSQSVPATPLFGDEEASGAADPDGTPASGVASDYEMVGATEQNKNGLSDANGELDELEAEIARELED